MTPCATQRGFYPDLPPWCVLCFRRMAFSVLFLEDLGGYRRVLERQIVSDGEQFVLCSEYVHSNTRVTSIPGVNVAIDPSGARRSGVRSRLEEM